MLTARSWIAKMQRARRTRLVSRTCLVPRRVAALRGRRLSDSVETCARIERLKAGHTNQADAINSVNRGNIDLTQ